MKDRFAAEWDEGISNQRNKGVRIGTLWRDADFEGDCTLTVEFLDCSPISRADVLGDIIGVLQREYDLAVKSIFGSLDG